MGAVRTAGLQAVLVPQLSRFFAGLLMVSLFPRFSQHIHLLVLVLESLGQQFFNALGGMRNTCFLSELFSWHQILADAALPPCTHLKPASPGFNRFFKKRITKPSSDNLNRYYFSIMRLNAKLNI